MKKNIILSCSMLCVALGFIGHSAVAGTFHADVLNSSITAVRTNSAGSDTTTFDMTSVTTGTASHIKLSYDCNVLGNNNSAYNRVVFKDTQGGDILTILGCSSLGVSDGESTNIDGDRIIPIPSGTASLELYAQQSGSVSYSDNRSRVIVDILGKESLPIDFNTSVFHDFVSPTGVPQNTSDNYVVEDNGATVHLSENTWKGIDYSYNITTDTVLEFDFYSTSEGEFQGIGFSNSLNLVKENMFVIYGSQAIPQAVNSYKTYTGNEGSWVHYKINVGTHYTGSFNYMFLINDDDSTTLTSNSYFKNVRVYEE